MMIERPRHPHQYTTHDIYSIAEARSMPGLYNRHQQCVSKTHHLFVWAPWIRDMHSITVMSTLLSSSTVDAADGPWQPRMFLQARRDVATMKGLWGSARRIQFCHAGMGWQERTSVPMFADHALLCTVVSFEMGHPSERASSNKVSPTWT